LNLPNFVLGYKQPRLGTRVIDGGVQFCLAYIRPISVFVCAGDES